MQEVFINIDDSGKLSIKESISVYGGIIFLSKKEKDKFITQYRSIINSIKEKYDGKEIKNFNIKAKDKRRIMNYLKKYYILALIINNNKVYDYILSNPRAKGRFLDYSLRRVIKEVIESEIKNNNIDARSPLNIKISIDKGKTKSNGYYNLRDGLLEELKYGINNFDYSFKVNPIVFSDLEVHVTYQDSKVSYGIQAADLIAGTIRKDVLNNDYEDLNKLCKYKLVMP